MIYVLYGENENDIELFINKLTKENNITDKVTYIYKECDIEDVIEEASYLDLFGNKKLVILNNAEFLTGKSTLESEVLTKYIENPNENSILVFKVNAEKLDDRKKLVKLLKEKGIIKEFKLVDEKNMPIYISEYFKNKGYSIDSNAIKEITSRLKDNSYVLVNELDKLSLYRLDTKRITLEDVKKVIIKYEENKAFKLVDAVIKNDKQNMFRIYKEMMEEKEEPAVIITLIANQLRLIYQASVLFRNGHDKYTISNRLKEHPYRVSLALESSSNIEEDKLLSLLNSLALIDYKTKKGELDRENALETFFLEI